MRVYVGLAVAAVLGLAGLVQAGPIDLKEVSADAKWAAHLDVDALTASKSLEKVRAEVFKQHPNAEAVMAALRAMWRFDPRTDLHSITIYGTQLKKDTGVAIIRAKVDQKFLLELVKAAPEYTTTNYGKYKLHSWVGNDKRRENGAFFQPDVLMFSKSLDDVKAALDVLDGTKPNFASKAQISPDAIPPGTILVAGARDLSSAPLPLKSPLAKQAESFLLIVGEKDGQLFVRASLEMKQAEIAKQIKAVADGALAFASLAKMDDPEVLKLVAAVKVNLADKTVSLEAQAPVDDIWTLIQKEHAKKMGGQ